MATDRFTLRPTEERDYDVLSELYARLTGRVRSADDWRWEWRAGPEGPAPSWVLLDGEDSGRIVGHHGVVPVPLVVGGRRVAAARTENTMLDPDYRTALHWPAYEKKCLRELDARYEVIFTCAGKSAAAAVRRRLGYKPVARWETHRIADTPAFKATKGLGAAGRGAGLLGGLALERPPSGWTFEATDDLERVARLWSESAPSHGIAPERSADYLRWRFADHPLHRYRHAIASSGGRDEAALAWWSLPLPGGAVLISIEDVFARGNDEDTLRAALRLFAWHHRKLAVRIQLRTLERDTPLRRAAAGVAKGWAKSEAKTDEAALLARGAAAPADGAWDVTMLVDEGLHDTPLEHRREHEPA